MLLTVTTKLILTSNFRCVLVHTVSLTSMKIHVGEKIFEQFRFAGVQAEITSPLPTDFEHFFLNPLTPNDLYISRTTPLTSKRCILYIYSTNEGTEYFKHALYSPFLFLFKMQFVS